MRENAGAGHLRSREALPMPRVEYIGARKDGREQGAGASHRGGGGRKVSSSGLSDPQGASRTTGGGFSHSNKPLWVTAEEAWKNLAP